MVITEPSVAKARSGASTSRRCGAAPRSPQPHVPFATQPRFQMRDAAPHSRGACRPSFAWSLHPLKAKRAQGRPGADIAPAVCCAKCTRRKPHSSIQVVPITRPSLRDGRTAYAVLSREPSSFWPPSRSRNSPAPAPVDANAASART